MKRLTTLLLTGLTLAILAGGFLPHTANAEGFALSDYGARGTALAGGMVGRADDASAVAWNPAGITQLPGTHTMMGATLIAPIGTVDTLQRGQWVSTDVKKNVWANPHAYLTYQYNDSVWLGLGLFSRFGLGNSYPSDWPGRVNLIDVSLQTVSLNPNIAYKVNDNLSLAIGFELMGASMEMRKDNPYLSNTGIMGYNRQKLNGRGVAPGLNLAAHYTFNEQWAAGFTYRSRVLQRVKGRSTFDKETNPVSIPALGVQIPAYRDSDLHGTLTLPEVFALGVTWRPSDVLSFEAGAVYTVWSSYRNLTIRFEDPMNYMARNEKNWHDTWTFNLSAEYKALDWLTLRCGYIYETSSMDMPNADYMTPSNGRERFTVGAGFNWDQWTLDVAYGYLIIKELDYDDSARRTMGVLPGKGHNGRAHIAAVSLGYAF